MPLFYITVVDTEGVRRRDVLWAATRSEALDRFCGEDAILLRVRGPRPVSAGRHRNVVVRVIKQLSTLCRREENVSRAVRLIAQGTGDPVVRACLWKVAENIDSGFPVGRAFAPLGDFLPSGARGLFEVAGQSPDVSAMFLQAAGLAARQDRARRRVVAALAYPFLVVAMLLLLVTGIRFMLFSPHADSNQESGRGTPDRVEGEIVHDVDTLLALLGSVLVSPALFRVATRYAGTGVRRGVERILCIYPPVAAYYRDFLLAPWCRCTAALLAAGLPLQVAVSRVWSATSSPLLREETERLSQALSEGVPLHDAGGGALILKTALPAWGAVIEAGSTAESAIEATAAQAEIANEDMLEALPHAAELAGTILVAALVMLVGLWIIVPILNFFSGGMLV